MSDLRQRAALAARAAGFLPVIEALRYCKNRMNNFRSNAEFRRSSPDYIFPPMWLAYDAYNNVDLKRICSEGKDQASRIVDQINTFTASQDNPLNVLEWGCGPGRVIQHLPRLLGERACLFATDYNPKTVDWCKSSIPGVSFAENGLAPPLRFESSTMDAVYSISVFTHLSEAKHFAWIKELERVLKPGGVLLVTMHGKLSCSSLTQAELKEFQDGKLVVRANVREGSRLYAAFHPDRFVSTQLLANFEILRKVEPFAPFMRQTLWVARKRQL